DDEDDEYADARIKQAQKPQEHSHLSQPDHELRAAQKRHEGTLRALARAGDHLVGSLALRVGHLAGRQRRHPLLENELSYDAFRFTHVRPPYAAVRTRSGRAPRRRESAPVQTLPLLESEG